jgi:dTDP-4-dehydrorhamnose 3,5-epimerase
MSKIEGVLLTQLKVIEVPGGDVLHGMKSSDPGYLGFGEGYFSTVKHGAVKAWKRHHKMTLNLVVPLGSIYFVIYDDRKNSLSNGVYQEVVLSRNNYYRMTVPPMVWMGFQGVGKNTNMLLNIADIEHTYDEADRRDINEIKYNWRLTK